MCDMNENELTDALFELKTKPKEEMPILSETMPYLKDPAGCWVRGRPRPQ
ncbi:MAG: hypothetical protein Q4C70_08575 [Planctomycetia bacterium]|nr:hypothetical protein [Planctomycetia bacterium]